MISPHYNRFKFASTGGHLFTMLWKKRLKVRHGEIDENICVYLYRAKSFSWNWCFQFVNRRKTVNDRILRQFLNIWKAVNYNS